MQYGKRFFVLQTKVLSFGPNRTVEVLPNSLAKPNVRSVTNVHTFKNSREMSLVYFKTKKLEEFPMDVEKISFRSLKKLKKKKKKRKLADVNFLFAKPNSLAKIDQNGLFVPE